MSVSTESWGSASTASWGSVSACAAVFFAEPRLAALLVAPSASATVACFAYNGSRTSSITARGALSPLRLPIFVIRV